MGITCPKCGSSNIQYASNTETQGFGCVKACLGTLLLGPFGWLCGLCGMGKGTTEKYWVCKNCGNEFHWK